MGGQGRRLRRVIRRNGGKHMNDAAEYDEKTGRTGGNCLWPYTFPELPAFLRGDFNPAAIGDWFFCCNCPEKVLAGCKEVSSNFQLMQKYTCEWQVKNM